MGDFNIRMLEQSIVGRNVEGVKSALDKGASPDGKTGTGKKPIHFAVESESSEIVKVLCESGANLDVQNPEEYGSTALHMAVRKGGNTLVKLLLGEGADPNLADERGDTALMTAIMRKEVGIVGLLLEHKADVHTQDKFGSPALHNAVKGKNSDIVSLLLQAGASVQKTDMSGGVMHAAARFGNDWILSALKEKGCDMDRKLPSDESSPLHLAAESGNLEAVRWLVENGAPLTETDKNGLTPEERAVRSNKQHVVVWIQEQKRSLQMKRDISQKAATGRKNNFGSNISLGNAGPSPNTTYSGVMPLHEAAQRGDLTAVMTFLQRGANVNQKDRDGCTPLHYAAKGGHLRIVKKLKEFGASFLVLDAKGNRPVHMAASGGHLDVLEYFLSMDTFADAPGEGGNSVVHIAASRGDLQMLHLLKERKCNMESRIPRKCSPLHLAIEGGHFNVAHYLVYQGADMTARNKQGKTPLELAEELGKRSIIEILQKASGKGTKDSRVYPELPQEESESQETKMEDVRMEIEEEPMKTLESELLIASAEGDDRAVRRLLRENPLNIEVTDNEGRRPLHLAALKGNLETVEQLLVRRPDLTATDHKGLSVVHCAVLGENINILQRLKHTGCNLKALTNEKCTVLHLAASKGLVNITKWLVNEAGLEVSATNKAGETALDLAIRNKKKETTSFLMSGSARIALQKGDVVTMLRLLSNGFDVNTKYEDKNFKDYRPLHFAAEEGHISVTCLLLDRNAHVNVQNSEGLTPLHLAAWAGHVEVIRALLSKRANPRLEDAEGRKPFHLASIGGHELALEALAVDGGIHSGIESVTNDSNRKTPLHLAAENGNLKAVRFLVEQKVEINKTDARGRTALQLAIDDFHKPVVEYLQKADPLVKEMRVAIASGDVRAVRDFLDRGINLKNPNLGDNGASILHTAVLKGNRDIFELLLRNGAPKDAVDRDGNTVTHYAAAAKDVVMLETLHNQNSVNLNAKNSEGNTPLHIAANKDSTEAIKWLLGNGARKNVKNNDMQTAERIAVAMKNYIAADIIKKHQSQYDDDAEGLANLGNTCYINTIIQCLFHIEGLLNLFKDGEYKQYMENGVLTNRVSETFADVVESLSTGGVDEMLLKKFKKTVCKYDNLFVGNDQHDAHDFFSAFTSSALSEFKAENNRFHILFYGTTCSTIKCKKCNTVALSTLEDFSSLKLSLQKTRSKLTDMARAYYEKQEIDWDCPTCKKLSRCERKVTVERLPEVLVIHFNRFLGNARSTFKAEVTYHTTIKVNDLIPREHRGSYIQNRTYDLRSVCSHVDSMVGGRYTAICQRNGKWNRFSDEIVTPVPERDAITNEALILFYEARR